MSGWLAITPHVRRVTRFALAMGLVAGCAAVLVAGQPLPEEKIDDRLPIPPENAKQTADAAKLRINKERAIFTGVRDKYGVVKGGIEDERPLASEKQNPDEYRAITEVMLHTSQFSAAVLAQSGRRDLTPDDLTYGSRFQYRLELVRFEGKLTKARRLEPTKSLIETGFKELYEAWLVPDDESTGYPLCLLLANWPANFAGLPEIPAGQQAGESVTIDKWVAFGGYSFKLMTYPGPGADPKNPIGAGWLKAPLLIGMSVVPTLEPAPKVAIDKNFRVYKEIRDKTRMAQGSDFWEESTAYNRVVLHARKFTTEKLEAEANRNLSFGDLFLENRKDYRLDLVLFHGHLIRLNKGKSPQRLIDAGLESWFEAWIIPDNEPRGNPICFVLTELPAGLEPKKTMDVAVTAAGYSFKLWRYESGEQDKDDPKKFVEKFAPLLIGRSLSVKQETDDVTTWWTQGFVPAVVASVALLGGAALALAWWFRRGDRAAQAEIEASRHRNPF